MSHPPGCRITNVRVALGFRVKTGFAEGLTLVETESIPRVLARHHLELSDPADPHARFPHHAALELPESEAAPIAARVTREVKARGLLGLRAAVEATVSGEASYELQGIGIVAGSVADPARVPNPHIRAHALEGKLFREALEEAARELGLPWLSVPEKTLYEDTARALGKDRATLDRALSEMGRAAGRPWRGEEKAASLAAWIQLVGESGRPSRTFGRTAGGGRIAPRDDGSDSG
jgi:hypothetical protein